MAKPPAPDGTDSTTLVIGVVVETAASKAPEAPAILRLTVPSVVLPLMNAAEIVYVPLLGSISKPKVREGTESVMVRSVTLTPESTRGVADSVLGGAAQVAHPPPGTVRTVRGVEKESVCVPSVTDETDVKLAGVIAMTAVELVYRLVGVETGVNCASAGATEVNSRQIAVFIFTSSLSNSVGPLGV